MNIKKLALIKTIAIGIFILSLILIGICLNNSLIESNFDVKNLSPSFSHLFGTDSLGRDIFFRTIKGLATSLTIGLLASIFSAIIALIIGVLSGLLPKGIDDCFGFLIDLVLSIPHLILLILISFSLGRGLYGVAVGLILSHWTGLARIIRAEVLSLKEEQYVKISKKLGKSNFYIIMHHLLPHLLPQFIIGTVILFPHAILHEASITFLGFGLPPESPAIGVMLAESMAYLQTGKLWYLLPGVCFVIIVLLFDILGKNFKILLQKDVYLEEK